MFAVPGAHALNITPRRMFCSWSFYTLEEVLRPEMKPTERLRMPTNKWKASSTTL
jgi:hypothetical protein